MRLQGEFSIEDKVVARIVESIQQGVERTIVAQFEKLRAELVQKMEASTPLPPSPTRPAGVECPEAERLKAADLRAAILLGRVSDGTGLLIDVKTTAKLLNVSERMVYRLADQRAAPTPIKLGALVRWRLAEIIQWIDDGCPSKWKQPQPKTGRR
jgi:predicted DNA-binding transcriptional regulator AlpA